MYILVCFIRNYYIGLLANNATWCQNRGCICISSTRRTYGRIHAVFCIHPVILDKNNNSANRIISQRKGERRSKERFFKDLIPARIQECFQYFYMQSSNYNYKFNSAYRINSTTRNTTTTRLIPCR